MLAFGGTVNRGDTSRNSWSIFRLRGEKSTRRRQYERVLPSRFKLLPTRITWAVEENPPVHVADADESDSSIAKKEGRHSGLTNLDATDPEGSFDPNDQLQAMPKMKYRCKLCGQLKQSHDCPYLKSLQRSIGITVYPAVNSYTADEPGLLAPPLTKMNNFVAYDVDDESDNPSIESRSIEHPSEVTPDVHRLNSSSTDSPRSSSHSPNRNGGYMPASGWKHHVKRSVSGHKRPLDTSAAGNGWKAGTPFVTSVRLRHEQYRAVTPVEREVAGAYTYPQMPISHMERRRLSDTLSRLCQPVPSLAEQCFKVLEEARPTQDWDLAVAEVLTQVVVGLYCTESDIALVGLQQYLLALGIAC